MARQSWVIFCATVMSILFVIPSVLFAVDDLYDAAGFDSNRETLKLGDFEHIDPFTGGLTLSFEDMRLPGNGGLDLVINRVYNSKNSCSAWYYNASSGTTSCLTRAEDSWVGLGWNLHFGRYIRTTPNPVIEMPDGSRHELFGAGSGVRITKDLWTFDFINRILTLTNGTKIYFNHWAGLNYAQGSGYDEYHASKIVDVHGNTITINYYESDSDNLADRPEYYGAIKSVTDSLGRTTYFYLTTSKIGDRYRLSHIQRPDNRYIYFSYQKVSDSLNTTALMTKVQPPVGNPWMYSYKTTVPTLDLVTVSTPYGGSISYTYGNSNASGSCSLSAYWMVLKKSVTGREMPSGTWTFEYFQDTLRDLTKITDPCGRIIKYRHYGYKTVCNQTGSMWKIGLPISKEIVGEQTISYEWTPSPAISSDDYDLGSVGKDYSIYTPFLSKLTISRDGQTYSTAFSGFDSYGNPGTISESGDKSRTTSKTYWYNTSKNIVKEKPATETVSGSSPGSFTTTYTYDSNGKPTQINKYGITTNYSYSSNGNLASSTDANSNVTSYQWSLGRISKISNPIYSISRSINTMGTLSSETNGRGYTTDFTYDGNLRLTKIDLPVGNSTIIDYPSDNSYKKESRGDYYTSYYFDGIGRPAGTKDGKGIITDIAYKSCGPKNYSTSNIGDSVFYDNLGRVISSEHQDGSKLTYSYYKSIVTATDEDAHKTVLAYNAFGNPDEKFLASATDSLNNTTSYDRNMLGSITKIMQGSMSRSFIYDSKNFLSTETHPETGTITYTRDGVGNMKSKQDGLGTKNYTYDSINRLKTINHGSGTVGFTYDNADNRTSMSSQGADMTYTYDATNHLQKKSESISGRSYITEYDYDSNDNIIKIKYPSGHAVNFGYNANNQVTSVTGFGASVSSVTYSTTGTSAGFPEKYNFTNGITTNLTYNKRNYITRIDAEIALDTGYSYDTRGNTLSITDYLDRTRDQSFSYDNLNRIIDADGAWGSGAYTYDLLGNRIEKSFAGSNTSYSYASNLLVSTSGGEPATYTYDGIGSLKTVRRDGVDYSLNYDWMDNLLSYKTATETLSEFTYDGDGKRVMKTTPDTTTVYHYDQDGNIISENDGSGGFIADYIYLNGKLIAKVMNDAYIPPDAPATLTATVISLNQVNLSWVDSSTNEIGFKIERKTGSVGTYTEIASVGADVTTFSNTGLSANTTYYYRIKAYNSAGMSGYSNEAQALTTKYTITASADSHGTITPSGSITVYHGNNKTFTIAPDSGHHIEDVRVDNVSIGAVTEYTFANITSNHAIAAQFHMNLPDAPSSLSGLMISPSRVDIQWTDNAINEAGFGIERKTGTTGVYSEIASVGTNTTAFSDTTVSVNSTFCYRIRAFNEGGVSGYSNEVCITVATHTITASAGPNGSIAPSGDIVVNHGASQTFTISPNIGYHVENVLVDIVSVGTVNTYTFANVTADHTIIVAFALNVPNISVSPMPVNFNYVNVGYTSSVQKVTVLNNGTDTLSIGAIFISGTNAQEFSITSDDCSGAALPISYSCDVLLKWSPPTAGAKFAILSIPSNDPDTPAVGVQLAGNAVVGSYSITGKVTTGGKLGTPIPGATIMLNGQSNGSITTDSAGNYTLAGLSNGTYIVTPSLASYTFVPVSVNVTITNANVIGQNFSGEPIPLAITGKITLNGSPLAGATVTLSGSANKVTTTNSFGNYAFSGLSNGSYTVTPSMAGYVFSPASRNLTISSVNLTGQDFTAAAGTPTYSISGTVTTGGNSLANVTLTLSGAANATTTTNASGTFTFGNLSNGNYTVTPSLTNYTFTPPSASVNINSANVTGVNFNATSTATYSISGTITHNDRLSTPVSGATVTLSGVLSAVTTTNSSGVYAFSGLSSGSYSVTPSMTGYSFNPVNRSVIISGANVTGQDFKRNW